MKNKEIKEAVRQAFDHAVPNVLDGVLSECHERKGTVIVMAEKKKAHLYGPRRTTTICRAR